VTPPPPPPSPSTSYKRASSKENCECIDVCLLGRRRRRPSGRSFGPNDKEV